jgi:hypothetical protein
VERVVTDRSFFTEADIIDFQDIQLEFHCLIHKDPARSVGGSLPTERARIL